jgi:hypothetical protein
VEVLFVAKIRGKQIAEGALGIETANLQDGILSADAAGRAKFATDFFDSATVTAKFASASIALDRLAEAVLQADGGQALTGDLPAGSNKITGLADPTAAQDAATKAYVDGIATGIAWKDPVTVFGMIGERTIAQIDALTPALGDSVVAADAGTPSAGTSDALAAGDIAEFDGTSWKEIVANSGGLVPAGVRVVLSTTQALQSPFTDATDDGRIVLSVADPGAFNGTFSDWNDTGDAVDGNAVLVQGAETNTAESANENLGYVFDGAVATGSWIQFTGAGQINAGAGLTKTGNTLSVNPADLISAGSAEIDGDQIDIDWNPTNYTPTTAPTEATSVDHLTAHLAGIDAALVVAGAAPVTSDKAQAPAATAGDDSDTGLTITSTPNGYVQVFVNGVKYELGDGVKTKDCYFTGDAGTTARAISAIVATDAFYWNGTLSGIELVGTDEVDFDYEA